MIKDTTLQQWINLVTITGRTVIRMGEDNESATTSMPDHIPSQDGEYWVAGTTHCKCGRELESVFIVDTNSGGTLTASYWKINDEWWDSQDRPAVFQASELSEEDIFPFDWSFKVPLEEDIYHD